MTEKGEKTGLRAEQFRCPYCGAKVWVINGRESDMCSTCGQIFYIHWADSEDSEGGASWQYLSKTAEGDEA
jgi:DNA-directed RNA polymerase subunit RPC12/RpoP